MTARRLGHRHPLSLEVGHRLGHRHPLSLEVGHRLDRRIRAHHQGLRSRRRRFLSQIGQARAGCQREDRHGIGDVGADIDAADVEGLQQGQATGEFVPAHRHPGRSQALFQRTPGPQQGDQGRGFLVADAQGGRFGSPGQWRQASTDAGSGSDTEDLPATEVQVHCRPSQTTGPSMISSIRPLNSFLALIDWMCTTFSVGGLTSTVWPMLTLAANNKK
jgi:hypothetical protein